MSQTIYASFADVAQAEKAAGALLDYGVRREDLSLVVNGGTDGSLGQEQEVGVPVVAYEGATSYSGLNYGASTVAPSLPGTYVGSAPVYGDVTPTADYDTARTDRYDRSTANAYGNTNDSSSGDAAAKSGITTTTAEDAGVGALKGTGIGLGLGVLAGLASLIVPGVGLVLGGGALATAIGAAALTTGAGAIAGGAVGYLKDQGVPEAAAHKFQETIGTGGAIIAVSLPSNAVDLQAAELVLNKYGAADISSY
jgi:hypothetical protein